MAIKTFSVTAPYWIHGHKNETGTSIANEINKRLADQGLCSQEDAQKEIDALGEDAELFGISLHEQAVEADTDEDAA